MAAARAGGLSFQRTRSWKASRDPDYETKAARGLDLYAVAPFDGPAISFDQMGPISLKPIQGAGWARRGLPERLRATYNRRHGIRYIFGRSTFTATGCTHGCDPAAPAATCSAI